MSSNNIRRNLTRICSTSIIPPGGYYQINDLLHSNGLELSSGYVSVYRISGYAPFHAYAVMHNRGSPDAVYISSFPRRGPGS